ncbi:LacI family DNA-binding transcriptional regulator [Saccharothrix sp. S26]|uniref:LacI family DNA-binding transcriptional regulator n=1 Tax=Saccharothrix sp. S26 TaxID=2907215 RepID=UPI001F17914A|nr:LacI family DNA-binding transcriptional regulator [Saccharothrix sp. S26]MCE6998732.1 LacI family DNA-binding transcriptional regulator [Saccharothrix sp. S26]
MGRRRITLADVAKATGVSTTTVSLVLAGRGRDLRISEEVERRVRSTAQELGYRRNTLSVGLRTGRTQTIGFVSDTVASSLLAGNMIKGALDAAHERGFMLFFGESGGDPDVERALVEAMHDRQVDGIIFAAMYTRRVAVPEGLDDGPAVLLNALPAAYSTVPAVLPDEVEAGRAAARVLVDAGHRDGVHVVGAGPRLRDVPPNSIAATERLIGIHEVFRAAGVEPASARQCPKWMPENGYETTREILRHHRPRALLCLNDRLAFGAYQALAEAGLSVPDDVSVVSFDDHPIASWVRPRLTTIALPHQELGAKAVEVLFAASERRRRGKGAPVVHRVPMSVRPGESVKPVGPVPPGGRNAVVHAHNPK